MPSERLRMAAEASSAAEAEQQIEMERKASEDVREDVAQTETRGRTQAAATMEKGEGSK